MERPRDRSWRAWVPPLLVLALAAGPGWTVDAALVRPQRAPGPAPAPRPQLQSLRATGPTPAGPFAPTAHPSLEGSPVEYLVLTNDTMAPAFERLAAWKTAKGVPAVVRTVSQAEASGARGSDLAEALRFYIRDAYLYWGVRFVLLGGDTDVLPSRYAAAEFLGLDAPVTDLYYACLDRDWNGDGDARFGEAYVDSLHPGDDADLVAEVFAGRAPVSTLAEANLFVDKTLAYERPSLVDFQDKFLLLAEVLFPANYRPGDPIVLDGASFAEELRLGVLPGTLRTTRLYETSSTYPGSEQLTRAAAIAQLDAGFGTVVHIGHGWRYTLSVGDGSLVVADAGSLRNGPRAGLVYMLNCTAAAYDFESFAEALLLNPGGGASIVVGAAREAFPLAASDYQRAFFTHVYAQGQRRVGEALARSREEFVDSAFYDTVDRWTQLVYTLLGDPEVPLWAGTPRALVLQDVPGGLQVGGQDLEFGVSDATGPVAGALVCAAKAGEEYRTARSDAAGRVRLRLEPRTTGTLSLTVTAPDHLPAQTTLGVGAPVRALVVARLDLTDDGAASGAGNRDGRLDAGETVRLGLPLRNAGTATSTGITATLASPDPNATVLQPASAYPDLGAGQEAGATTPYVVRIAASLADQTVVELSLRILHDGGVEETRRVELVVHAARPRLAALRLDDSRAGDGDGQQDPNEVIDLWYTVENLGGGTAQQVALELASLDPGLEVLGGAATLPEIAPGARAESPTPLSVREADLGVPHRGRLLLRHLQNAAGAARRIDLRPPASPSAPRFVATDRVDAVHVEWTAPVGNDLLGYRVERAVVPGGAWVEATEVPVRPTYFGDRGLAASTRYAYRIVAVDSTLLAGSPGASASVSTNPPQVAGWPLSVDDNSASSVVVADVDGDGAADVVAPGGEIYAWSGTGVELLDADRNPFTWGVFYGANEGYGSATLADLDRTPGKEVVAATWDATVRQLACVRRDGTPLPGWPRPLVAGADAYRGALVPPVVANLDGGGAPEILLAARDGRLYGWHADGSEIVDGDANPATQGVLLDTGSPFLRSAPGVADLDPSRSGAEIVLGGTNGVLYAIDARGVPLPGWPRTTFGEGTAFGGYFACGVSIADLDRDGQLEIVVTDGGGRVHALHADGSEMPGWPVGALRVSTQSVVPAPALGDLAGDGRLEVVAAGVDGKVYVFDTAGQPLLPGGYIALGSATESSPILGDVDGDAGIEIVLGGEEGVLGAWNLDGSPVDGFPISFRSEVRGTPTLADADGDGSTNLVVLPWDGSVRVYDLGVPWVAARYPWPTARGSVHRTGEYGYVVPTPVAVQDLAAVPTPGGAVRLGWHGSTDGGDPTWRIVRAGPFAVEPLGSLEEFAYTGETIGEVRGSGDLQFVDPDVQPGAWYVYVLGVRDPGGGETLAGPVIVATPFAKLRMLSRAPLRPGEHLWFEIPSRPGSSLVEVRLTLFDVRGRRVREFVRGRLAPGRHALVWDGRDASGAPAASGVYLARLAAGGGVATAKLALLR